MAELAATEPRHIAEFVVSGGGNAADDPGLIDGGDVGGPVAPTRATVRYERSRVT